MLTSPNVDNQSGVLCNWHDTNHHALCQVYQEFAYQTTYISADFSMDSLPKDVTKPIVQQVQIVAKIVPISQIRVMIPPDISMNTVAFNPNTDFGKCSRVLITMGCLHLNLARSNAWLLLMGIAAENA